MPYYDDPTRIPKLQLQVSTLKVFQFQTFDLYFLTSNSHLPTFEN